jgi:hypothetical protein
MAIQALNSSHSEAPADNVLQSGAGAATPVRDGGLIDLWPLAVFAVGLLASASWVLGLLYAGYRALLWLVGD